MKTISRMKRTALPLSYPLSFFLPLLLHPTEKAVAQDFLGKFGTGSPAPHFFITVSSQLLFDLLTPIPISSLVLHLFSGCLVEFCGRTLPHFISTRNLPMFACSYLHVIYESFPSTDDIFCFLPPVFYRVFYLFTNTASSESCSGGNCASECTAKHCGSTLPVPHFTSIRKLPLFACFY